MAKEKANTGSDNQFKAIECASDATYLVFII